MFLTQDTTLDVNNELQEDWDYNTLLYAKFNGNTKAGNIDKCLEETTHLIIKSRKVGDFEWQTLAVKEVHTIEDFALFYNDYFVPSGQPTEYAIVHSYYGIDRTYSTVTVTPQFDQIFLIKGEEVFKLFKAFEELGYSDMSYNFTASQITDSSMIDLICDSTIFNATVISKLTSTKPIYVEDNDKYRVIDEDQKGNKIIYLTKDEIKNFLEINNEVNGGNLSGISPETFFNAIVIKEEKEIIKDLDSSNIVYNLVSEYLLSIANKYSISLDKVTLNVCDLISKETSDKEVVSKESIISTIVLLKTYEIIK